MRYRPGIAPTYTVTRQLWRDGLLWPMPEIRVFPLPDGLPASLKGGPKGFNALCAWLGIVGRQDKRQLRNHSRVSKILKA